MASMRRAGKVSAQDLGIKVEKTAGIQGFF